jgi:conserved oligomeric Golgi complex subunit 4
MLMVANMDDEEWDELVGNQTGDGDDHAQGDGGGSDGGMQWILTEEERRKARTLVRMP